MKKTIALLLLFLIRTHGLEASSVNLEPVVNCWSIFHRDGGLVMPPSDEEVLCSVVVDRRNGYSYFGTNDGKIVRVNLSNFSIEDKLDLGDNTIEVRAAIVDPVG